MIAEAWLWIFYFIVQLDYTINLRNIFQIDCQKNHIILQLFAVLIQNHSPAILFRRIYKRHTLQDPFPYEPSSFLHILPEKHNAYT